MKKVFLLVMLVAGILFGAEAQNRSINFEQTKVWKQIVKKAKKEKKLIFVDCYTSGAARVRCWRIMCLLRMK